MNYECVYCEEEHEEDAHGESVVSRMGAAARTADDLAITFLEDVADLIEGTETDTKPGHSRSKSAELRADAEAWWKLAIQEGDMGCHWLPTDDEHDYSAQLEDDVRHAEGLLSAAGFYVDWNDGYTIVGSVLDVPSGGGR